MDSIHTRINENTPTEKSVGVNLCFLHIKFRLSVGAFFERPRANTVRPYRALYNFFDKNITHFAEALFSCGRRYRGSIWRQRHSNAKLQYPPKRRGHPYPVGNAPPPFLFFTKVFEGSARGTFCKKSPSHPFTAHLRACAPASAQ